MPVIRIWSRASLPETKHKGSGEWKGGRTGPLLTGPWDNGQPSRRSDLMIPFRTWYVPFSSLNGPNDVTSHLSVLPNRGSRSVDRSEQDGYPFGCLAPSVISTDARKRLKVAAVSDRPDLRGGIGFLFISPSSFPSPLLAKARPKNPPLFGSCLLTRTKASSAQLPLVFNTHATLSLLHPNSFRSYHLRVRICFLSIFFSQWNWSARTQNIRRGSGTVP